MLAINRYDEFGIPQASNTGRFQYTGQAWLAELGMQYSKARVYSPTLGRFMQTDPIGYGDGLNWYDYVHGDSVNLRDPSGLACQAVTGSRIPDCGTFSGPTPGQSRSGYGQSTGEPSNATSGTRYTFWINGINVGSIDIYHYDFSAGGSGLGGLSAIGGFGGSEPGDIVVTATRKNKQQKAQPPCVNADGTVDGKNTGSNMPGFGDVWATGGGVVAAAGAGGGIEKGVWYDRASGAHGTFVTTYYMVGTPGGGVAGNVTNFSDLASFTGWSTGVSGAGAVFGGGGAQSSTGGWGHTISGGFRTPQLSAYKSYTTITSGLSICKK